MISSINTRRIKGTNSSQGAPLSWKKNHVVFKVIVFHQVMVLVSLRRENCNPIDTVGAREFWEVVFSTKFNLRINAKYHYVSGRKRVSLAMKNPRSWQFILSGPLFW